MVRSPHKILFFVGILFIMCVSFLAIQSIHILEQKQTSNVLSSTTEVTPPELSPAPTTQPIDPSQPCHGVNGLPDHACTPGAIDERVTQENINQTICVAGYTKTVRPPVSYTNPLKLKIMARYGYTDSPKNYELDHLISLEIGGNPTSEANLWPEPYESSQGARTKDAIENYLHKQVCAGIMLLSKAQEVISTNWEQVPIP